MKREGTKHDQGKLRYDLISAVGMEELAKVYTYGAKKYADHNWRKGIKWSFLKVLHIQKIRTLFEKVFVKENLIAIPQKRKHKHTANRYTTTLESVDYFDEYYFKNSNKP